MHVFVKITPAQFKALADACDSDPELVGVSFVMGDGRAWKLADSKTSYVSANSKLARFQDVAAAHSVLRRLGTPKDRAKRALVTSIVQEIAK